MKRIAYFVLTPLITIFLLIIKFPKVECETDKWPTTGHIILVIATILATGYSYYITVVSPYKEVREIQKKRWSLVEKKAEEIITALKASHNFDLSYNMMVPRRKLYCYRIEPGKAISFFPKVFSVVWSCGTRHVHSRLRFTIHQGSCGHAYRNEDYVGFDLEDEKRKGTDFATKFNLTEEQVLLTEKIRMVASAPIILKRYEPEGQKIQLIGIINVECHMENSGALMSDPINRQIVMDSLTKLANAYATSL